MSDRTIRITNEADLSRIAKKITTSFQPGDVVALQGLLGTGKTTLVRHMAETLGIKVTITSPTFSLMNTYDVKPPKNGINKMIHIDTYRFTREDEIEEIGALDFIGAAGTLTFIEWPEKIARYLRDNTRYITLAYGNTPNERTITFDASFPERIVA
jgi:tRNA threonylcarbamoyladenosine biosynthesis protein TsaE